MNGMKAFSSILDLFLQAQIFQQTQLFCFLFCFGPHPLETTLLVLENLSRQLVQDTQFFLCSEMMSQEAFSIPSNNTMRSDTLANHVQDPNPNNPNNPNPNPAKRKRNLPGNPGKSSWSSIFNSHYCFFHSLQSIITYKIHLFGFLLNSTPIRSGCRSDSFVSEVSDGD